jgi:acetyltransferase-like isoleucine patch superfamily enzyme
MIEPSGRRHGSRAAAWGRIAVAVISIVVLQSTVCGLAALPVVVAWQALPTWVAPGDLTSTFVFGMLLIPSYVGFALCLLAVSPLATWMARLRTPRDTEMRIADMEWRLLWWAHYMTAIHIVRVFAGRLFRGSPLWTAYLRMNGARIGRGVYVNSLAISDHNLLELGDDVVIGDDVHLSGHVVEAGVVKTAGVRIAGDVTIGVGTVVGIGVVIERGCQIGALSLVLKHTALTAGGTYVGAPVHRLETGTPSSTATNAQ